MPRSGPTGSAWPYRNPFRDARNLTPERIDMGVDYAADAGSPIYSIGPGVVTSIRNAGWPGGAFIAVRFTDGPFAGRYWYFAELIQPAVAVGQQVDTSTVLGYFSTSGGPGIETGWAAPPGTGNTLAAVNGQACNSSTDPGCHQTWYGASASAFLAMLGAPAGLANGAVVGTGPSDLPQPGQGGKGGGIFNPAGAQGCVTGMMFLPFILAARLLGLRHAR